VLVFQGQRNRELIARPTGGTAALVGCDWCGGARVKPRWDAKAQVPILKQNNRLRAGMWRRVFPNKGGTLRLQPHQTRMSAMHEDLRMGGRLIQSGQGSRLGYPAGSFGLTKDLLTCN